MTYTSRARGVARSNCPSATLLLQPLIDPSRNVNQVDVYSAREKEALFAYQQAVAQAFREVSDALAAREGYANFLRAQEDQVAAHVLSPLAWPRS